MKIKELLPAIFKREQPAEPVRIEPKSIRFNKRMYGGATFDRLTTDWLASATSQDSETYSSLRALRNRSRQLCRDNDYAKNAIRSIKNNVIGRGIRMQAKVKLQRGDKLNENLNEQIEREWRRWCRAQRCDVAGKLSFEDIERMAMGGVAESGEIFVRLVRQKFGDSRVPLGLEMIEADQCMEWRNGYNGDNQMRMGVEMDQWKRPVAYWFFPNHPGDFMFQMNNPAKWIRLVADEVIHLGIADRPNQTRYIPWFHSALRRLHQMEGYEESEVVSARATASLMGFLETEEPADEDDDGTQDGQIVDEFSPGMIRKLAAGEKFNAFNPQRPTGVFDPFMRAMLRGVAAGVGVSYETLSKDYSQSNYSSSRLALNDDRDTWRVLQHWVIRDFHRRVFAEWLDMAVLSGVIDIPDYYAKRDDYLDQIHWQPRGWSWVDPEKEVNAAKTSVRAGFETVESIIEQNGGDFEEVMERRKREVELFKEAKLVFDTDPSQVDNKGAGQKAYPSDTGEGEVAPNAAPVAPQTKNPKNPGTNDGGLSKTEQKVEQQGSGK